MNGSLDLSRLRVLLENEKYPLDYTLKFIGRNSPEFKKGVEQFERSHPKLKRTSERASSGDANLALTYVFQAVAAIEIISVIEAVAGIADLRVIL